jgi:hypothetical protein
MDTPAAGRWTSVERRFDFVAEVRFTTTSETDAWRRFYSAGIGTRKFAMKL